MGEHGRSPVAIADARKRQGRGLAVLFLGDSFHMVAEVPLLICKQGNRGIGNPCRGLTMSWCCEVCRKMSATQPALW